MFSVIARFGKCRLRFELEQALGQANYFEKTSLLAFACCRSSNGLLFVLLPPQQWIGSAGEL
jgi:hypothetical protein